MDFHERAQFSPSKHDLALFIAAFGQNLEQNHSSWQNGTLESFLSAMEAWVIDMDAY